MALDMKRAEARCGKDFGGVTCDATMGMGCCSQYGFCGSTSDFCLTSQGCQSGCTTSSTSIPSILSTSTLRPSPSSSSTASTTLLSNTTNTNSTSNSTTSSDSHTTNVPLALGLGIPLGLLGLFIFIAALWIAGSDDDPFTACFSSLGRTMRGVSKTASKVRPLGVDALGSRSETERKKKKKKGGGLVATEAVGFGYEGDRRGGVGRGCCVM